MLKGQNHVCHKVRIRTKTPCLPAHCLITAAGHFYKSQVIGLLKLMKSRNPTASGNRTLVLGMAHWPRSEMKTMCLLTGFIRFWRRRKKVYLQLEVLGCLREIEFNVSWNTNFMFSKDPEGIHFSYSLRRAMSWFIQFLPIPVKGMVLRCMVVFSYIYKG